MATIALGIVVLVGPRVGDKSLFGKSKRPALVPNVLLITLDTTRADRIGCYGYQQAVTPTIDALAQSGVRFEQAFCQVPLTLPSHTSLLTGLYPPTTGVRINGTAGIGPDVPTLAQMFKEHGYRTAAFIATQVLDSAYGLASGFDLYDDDLRTSRPAAGGTDDGGVHLERRADHICEAALSWLADQPDTSFFAWVHFFDPHSPYEPVDEFAARFVDPYDGEIAYVDSQIARLVAWLDEAGLRDRTMIVIAGDHGEGFKEHEEAEHGFFVYNNTMQVPLILSFPGRIPSGSAEPAGSDDPARTERQGPSLTSPSPVGLVDVFPTIIDLLGWELPAGLEGRSLAEACRTGELPPTPVYGECEYPRLSFGWAELRSLTTDRWKYIDAPRPELYDRQNDPGEVNNVIEAHGDIAEKMRSALLAEISGMSTQRYNAKRVELSDEKLNQLAALGYVAIPSVPEELDDDVVRRDPKDMHPVFMKFTRALGMLKNEQYEEAAAVLEKLSRQSPESGEIHSVLGSAYLLSDRYPEAQRAFEQCLKTSRHSPRPLCGLGDALQKQDRLQEAIVFYEQALELSPDWEPAHRELGTIFSKLKQFPKAEKHWRRSVDLRPGHAHYLTNLGTVLLAVRRPKEAIPLLESALQNDPDNEFAHRSLWQCYRAVGRRDDALRGLRAAREVLPAELSIVRPLAWMLVTSPTATTEDVRNAVLWAEQFCNANPENARDFDILAAAYAANGDFAKAVEAVRRAITLATARGQVRLQRTMEARLNLYEAGQRFEETAAQNR